MKTPSPQEAAKMTNRQIASEIATDCVNAIGAMALPIALKREPEAFDLCGKIERALDAKELEADKNGYERGRKEDDGLLLDIHEMLILGDCVCMPGNGCTRCALLKKVEARLAPSVGLSEAQKLLADSGGEKKA